ncbi:zinc carboxypeptidase [Nocardia tenerifensis]|uniref:Zinc carboxypeptidase n=1 Tax=Nocardia tenerifensis TaxID=228006 RepID=A0A318KN58_9NOCA|nr:M14 family zinc carboxypeptidase [Nocardia tenerifensis]PXX71100.1 zinc carboxypeptidase [Nocardia tenerifensis]
MVPQDEVAAIVGQVERTASFPTVDELNRFIDDMVAAHPDRVAVEEIGRSRGGDPLREVRIGTGPRHLVVLGNPHPNEPIGMATIRHLIGRLARDEADTLGATWHFVPCVDPDGTRLNEGWFARPLTRTSVARGYYRPAGDEQPEWCFPITWRGAPVGVPMPETRALMALIDRTKPALIASLHNADFGGGFFYCSGGDAGYWSALGRLLDDAGVPRFLGEPDAPGAARWAEGVFELPAFEKMADALTAVGVDPVATIGGGGSRDYAAPYGTAVLVSELPLWVDERIGDKTVSDRSIGSVVRSSAASYREIAALVAQVLERLGDRLTGRSPFERALRAVPASLSEMAVEKEAASGQDRLATRGEIFMEEYVWTGMLRLRTGGLLLRLLDAEAERDPSPVVAAEKARVATVFDGWSADIERNAPGEPVPLAALITIQAGSIVTAAARLRDGLPV